MFVATKIIIVAAPANETKQLLWFDTEDLRREYLYHIHLIQPPQQCLSAERCFRQYLKSEQATPFSSSVELERISKCIDLS